MVFGVIGVELFRSCCCDFFLQSSFFCSNYHVVILAPRHTITTIDLSASPASLGSLMNSTNIWFTAEFMQTLSTKRQTSPPCCSAQCPLNCVAKAQGGQADSQHASPALPVELPHTTVVFSSSTHLTRSSSKAPATTLPKDVPHLPDSAGASNKEFVHDSAEANSTFCGLTLIPELPGTSEMPTASI